MPVSIRLDDTKHFNSILKASMADTEDCTIVTKPHGTVEGRPVVMISFQSKLPGRGKTSFGTAQKVLTVREFLRAADAIRARYGDMSERTEFPDEGDESVIKQNYRNMTWSAMLKEQIYLVGVEGIDSGISLAGSPKEAEAIGKLLIDRHLSQREAN